MSKKDTFYFSHDYNARTDAKIRKLISRHGMLGYGVYWAIIEDLYNNANALQTDYELIAYDLRVEQQAVKDIVEGFDLFCIDGDYFGSMSVERRLNQRSEKSRKARESASYRWNKKEKEQTQSESDTNAMRTHTDSNAIKERKGKEKKDIYIVPHGTDLLIDFTLEVDLEKFSLYEKTAIGFFKLIKTNLQNNGQNNFNTYDKSKLSVWSNQIRLMVEQDKRQMSEIREIYAFLNNGIGAEFWQRTAQSMNSIRKSFDKIYLEAKRSEKEKKKETTSSGINYNIVQ